MNHHFVTVGLAFVFELGFKVRIGVIVYTFEHYSQEDTLRLLHSSVSLLANFI